MTPALLSQLYDTPLSSITADDGFALFYHGRQALPA